MIPTDNGVFTPEVLAWYREILEYFGGEKRLKSDTDADVLCPVHGDRNPSLGVDLRENGKGPKIVIICRSQGCEFSDVIDAVGLEPRDLYFDPAGKDQTYGCTLDSYAQKIEVPVGFLANEGLENSECHIRQIGRKVESVAIPYPDEEGRVLAVRHRVSIKGEDRFRWRQDDNTMLYGLNGLDDCREAGYALIVEGESDVHTAWYRGIPAIGVPGAYNWKPAWASYLDGIERLIVIVEPGGAGQTLWEALLETEAIRARLEKMVLS